MKTLIYFLCATTLVLFSCGQNQTNHNDLAEFDDDSEYYFQDNDTPEFNETKISHTEKENLKGYKVMSKQFGIPVGIMPIPKHWNVKQKNKEGILFQSHDGVKVYGERFVSYFYSNNQQLNYFTQQSGKPVAPVKNVNSVIQEDILPHAKSQGLKLLKQFSLPELAQFDKRFDSYLFKGIPENKQFQCIATEWEDQNGEKSIGIIRYFTNQYPSTGGMDWGYTLNAMGAPANIYENAKKAFINALVNFKINPQWVQTSNNFYSQKSRQGAAQHQQRMAAINTQGQASRNLGNTYSSISDSSFESWKRINDMNNAGHSKSINNGIWERTTISSPNTGQRYYVEGQNNYYWMNQNNEYLGTDNSLYNPNTDNAINNQQWSQYNIEN
ncbi:hypothetical protein CLV33_10137 [Jejuia pallidilutea]|uniref:Lipoprotein n=1 Tax=Jejuia pallidilutea TaxID=504487 RepID=A0A362X310_9FLAO|nr:hypothetical protein [Jejuia pallidilutea]PQV51117.1 hypothetical protein CLV33_10137 [Jejuia pallidilutea]